MTKSRPHLNPEEVSLRTIAIIEFFKGAFALLAASGIAFYDKTGWVPEFAEHLHFDPASDHPNAFLHALQSNASSHLRLIALGALVYALVRIAEGIGLWYDKRWASWVGVISAATLLPVELIAFIRHQTVLRFVFFAVTAAIVAFLAYHLRLRIIKRAAAALQRPS